MATINEKIISALKPFDLPVYPDFYDGNEDEYFTFNTADDRGDCYADDRPTETRVSMQIHLFLDRKKDYLQIKKQVREALMDAGFTYPSIGIGVDDGKIRHVVFECEILEDQF